MGASGLSRGTACRCMFAPMRARLASYEVVYMTADVEDQYIVAQAAEPTDEAGHFLNERITCRHRDEIIGVEKDKVDFVDISPRMMVSIATAMILSGHPHPRWGYRG